MAGTAGEEDSSAAVGVAGGGGISGAKTGRRRGRPASPPPATATAAAPDAPASAADLTATSPPNVPVTAHAAPPGGRGDTRFALLPDRLVLRDHEELELRRLARRRDGDGTHPDVPLRP